jgi:hypothetical protein
LSEFAEVSLSEDPDPVADAEYETLLAKAEAELSASDLPELNTKTELLN